MGEKFEFEKVSFFSSSLDQTLFSETIFGLGENYYEPSTDTIRLIVNHTKGIEKITDSVEFWRQNPTFGHEFGHYYLSNETKIGTIIHNISAFIDAIFLIIIQRMLRLHNKILIPFKKYLEFKYADAELKSIMDP